MVVWVFRREWVRVRVRVGSCGVCMCVYMYVCMYVCMCVCVCVVFMGGGSPTSSLQKTLPSSQGQSPSDPTEKASPS